MADKSNNKNILIFSLDTSHVGRGVLDALRLYRRKDNGFTAQLTDEVASVVTASASGGLDLLVLDCATETTVSLEVMIRLATATTPAPPMLLLTSPNDHNQTARKAMAYGVLDTLVTDTQRVYLELLPFLAERLLDQYRTLPFSDAGHALHRSRTYRKMLATTTDGLFALDAAGHFWDANPGFLDLTGFTRRELIGEPAGRVFQADSIPGIMRQFSELDENDHYQLEVSARDTGQQLLVLQMAGMLFRDGDEAYLLSSVRDITEVRQLSAVVRESEERYRNIFEATPVGLALLDGDLRITACNGSFSQHVGQPDTSMTGKPITDPLPDNRRAAVRSFLQSMEEGKTSFHETTDVSISGRRVDLAVYCRCYRLRSQKQYLVATQDITERNRVLRQLQESETRFREIFDSPAFALGVVNREGRLVEINQAACALTGYDREELLNLERRDYVQRGSLDRIRRYTEILEQGGSCRERLDIRKKDGTSLPVEIFVSPFQYRGEKHYLSVAHDLSQTVQVEQYLHESQQRLIAQFEQSPLAIIEINLEGKLVDWNPAAETMFGYRKEEVLGTRAIELLVPENARPQAERAWEKLNSGSSVNGVELEMANRQGGLLITEWYVNPLLNENAKTMGYIGNARDITEQKQLESQLTRVQKMEAIGQLTGGIAHDFNNILTGVLGYAELASERLRKKEDFDFSRYLKNIIQAAGRARDLVRQLLTYSRTEEVDLLPLDPVIVVKEVVNLLKSTMPSTLALTLDWETDIGLVRADAVQLHQVLMNLCINAQQALTSEHGKIEIFLSATTVKKAFCSSCHQKYQGKYLNIRIKDDGVGMDAETREKMFDPFFTTKKVGEGSGMGLSVVHGIIHQHGGHIAVRSRLRGGTTVDIRLPLVQISETTASQPADHSIPPLGQGQKILVVDDEPTICEYLEEVVKNHGYQVVSFTSPGRALETYLQPGSGFSLVLSDYTMPDMTGAELAQRILLHDARMPVIICTGHSDSFNEKKASQMGVRKLFQKPVHANDLLWAIHHCLATPPDAKG